MANLLGSIKRFFKDEFDDEFKNPSLKKALTFPTRMMFAPTKLGWDVVKNVRVSPNLPSVGEATSSVMHNPPEFPHWKDPATTFVSRQLAAPLYRIPKNVFTIKNKNKPLSEKVIAGIDIAGAMSPGPEDVAFGTARSLMAIPAGKNPIKAFTGEEQVSLGDITNKTKYRNSRARTALDLAELPLSMIAVGKLSPKQEKIALNSSEDLARAIKDIVKRPGEYDFNEVVKELEKTYLVKPKLLEKLKSGKLFDKPEFLFFVKNEKGDSVFNKGGVKLMVNQLDVNGFAEEMAKKAKEIKEKGKQELAEVKTEVAKGGKEIKLPKLTKEQKYDLLLPKIFNLSKKDTHLKIPTKRLTRREIGQLFEQKKPTIDLNEIDLSTKNKKIDLDTLLHPDRKLLKQVAAKENLTKGFEWRGYKIKPKLIDAIRQLGSIPDSVGGNIFGTLDLRTNTPERIFRKSLDDEGFKAVKEFLLDPIKRNEEASIDFLNKEFSFWDKVAKKYNIQKGNKISNYIQLYGEKEVSLPELKKALPNDWKKVVEAEKIFRKKYDNYLEMLNKVRAKYGLAPIKKKEDYFIHQQYLENLFDEFNFLDKSNELPIDIAGKSQWFDPDTHFAAFKLKRKGANNYFPDAMWGMEKYLQGLANQLYHTDTIQRTKAIDKIYRDIANINPNWGTGAGSRFKNWFERDYKPMLQGKMTNLDRVISEQLFGRPLVRSLDWAGKQVGNHLTGYNVSTAVSNIAAMPNSMATTSVKGQTSALKDLVDFLTRQEPIEMFDGVRSNFLLRRHGKPEEITKWSRSGAFGKRLWEDIRSGGRKIFELTDLLTSRQIVGAKYREGLSKGLSPEEAMRIADEYAANIMGDRSFGQIPTAFRHKSISFGTQFQLEVNNVLRTLLEDMPYWAKQVSEGDKVKFISTLSKYYTVASILSYLYNSGVKALTGHTVLLDPIRATLYLLDRDGVFGQYGLVDRDESGIHLGKGRGDSPYARVERALLEIGQQLPFISAFIGGGRVPLTQLFPSSWEMKNMFTAETEAEKQKQLLSNMVKLGGNLVLPTGMGQLKKTLTGLQAINQGGKIRDYKLMFPIDDTALAKIQAVTFGPYASKNAQLYFDESMNPLSEDETLLWKSLVERGTDPTVAWATIYQEKLARSFASGLNRIINNLHLSLDEKKKEIELLKSAFERKMYKLGEIKNDPAKLDDVPLEPSEKTGIETKPISSPEQMSKDGFGLFGGGETSPFARSSVRGRVKFKIPKPPKTRAIKIKIPKAPKRRKGIDLDKLFSYSPPPHLR